jgi:hypothetical protein
MYEIRENFEKLLFDVENLPTSDAAAAERAILRWVLALGLQLLKRFFIRCDDEVRKAGAPMDSSGRKAAFKGRSNRLYQSVFGMIDIARNKYYSVDDKSMCPLDAKLNLPAGQLSFVLSDWLGSTACEEDFRESTALLNKVLGLDLNHMQSHRNLKLLGAEVGGYYAEKGPPDAQTEGSYLAIEVDGKGVRVVEPERAEATAAVEGEKARLMKGQKRGHKRIATLALMFSFNPFPRTKEEMLKTLHKKWTKEESAVHMEVVKELGERPREARNTHCMAFLLDQAEAIAYGVRNLMLRDLSGEKPIIALVDGGNGLEDAIRNGLETEGMGHRLEAVILDIIHVIEYLWVAANAILGENAHNRLKWIETHILMILDSKVAEVVDVLQKHHDKAGTTKSACKAIMRTIHYYQNHGHKMDYKDYLAKGFPISTGLVEGACGHLVKDRMERSGMQWTIEGAQAELDARAVKRNGDWDHFIHKIEEANRERYDSYAA